MSIKYAEKSISLLQWGRDHVIAETALAAFTTLPAIKCFNGAAIT